MNIFKILFPKKYKFRINGKLSHIHFNSKEKLWAQMQLNYGCYRGSNLTQPLSKNCNIGANIMNKFDAGDYFDIKITLIRRGNDDA